ncbi:MAG: hypothetical protein AABX66_01595 [Nanoarchaeota archaeon]
MNKGIPQVIGWNEWLSYVLGQKTTFSQIRGNIGDQIRKGQSKVGYDTPPNPDDQLISRFEAFMSMKFEGFPIDPKRSDSELYLITQALKRFEQEVHPPERFDQLKYYGPAFEEVEEGFAKRDGAKIRSGINNLIDLELHN